MPQSPQSALKTAANRLAKEARHLHKAAQATELVATPVTPDVDAFIAEMASLGTKKQAEVAQQAAERTSEAQRVIAPLVARARQLLAEGEAVKEHAALIGKLVALPRDTIRKTVRVRVTPGSSETTLTRLAFLRRTVTEVQELLGADDRDVEKCLGAVERLTTVADQNGKLAIAHLQ
jgi:hypothetical protein